MKRYFLLLLPVMLFFSSCLKEDQECEDSNCAFIAPLFEIQDLQNYLSANNIQATQHCSGLFYRIESPGTGDQPSLCANVSAAYRGTLTNGYEFDASATPIAFDLQGVIRGWTVGLPLIKEGGRIMLYVPPSLAYGSQSGGGIPPNSILIFDVHLASVN